MSESFPARADVKLRDGLVCITLEAPGAPETVLRLPRGLAVRLADQIKSAALHAPSSWPTTDTPPPPGAAPKQGDIP